MNYQQKVVFSTATVIHLQSVVFCLNSNNALLFSRPSFITLYFNEPDKSGHRYGPNSTQVSSAACSPQAWLIYYSC